jgi:oligoribonuclease NrnB/cAMP/cGMP phosphodiesterase (DHH superfamily)
MFSRLVTHDDFDGVASAALAGYFLEISSIIFAGPGDITRSTVSTGEEDVVCDLPYPLTCGMWFDHHEANLEEVRLRGIDPDTIPGHHLPAKSCARVILEYYAEEYEIDEELEVLAAAADRIDAFDYESVEDWRSKTPAAMIDSSIKLKTGTPAERRAYLRQLTSWLMDEPLEQVAGQEQVQARALAFEEEEKQMLKIIEQNLGFLDGKKEVILLDFSGRNRRVAVVKNLAQLLAPEALAVIEVNSLFNRGVKTNDLSFSMSLNIEGTKKTPEKDLGEIMRALNIGSGHAGAASGTVRSKNKQEMLKAKEKVLQMIIEKWENS